MDCGESMEVLFSGEAREGRIALGAPTARRVPIPARDWRVVDSALKRRR